MAKEEVAEQGESKPWWAIDKAAWKERLSGFYRLASIADGRDAPLRRWSDADVEEFVNTDPVYGPQVIPPLLFLSLFFLLSSLLQIKTHFWEAVASGCYGMICFFLFFPFFYCIICTTIFIFI